MPENIGQAVQIALISDIHGNVEALDAVLADIDQRSRGARIICAGDVVGYGPDPQACIRRLASRSIPCVMGNHDEMVLGQRDFSRCVYAGIVAARWTRRNLDLHDLLLLQGLPNVLEVTPEIVACHGTLADADKYVSSEAVSVSALAQLKKHFPEANVLVCGHTHHAAVYCKESGFLDFEPESEFAIPTESCCLINPGAVGQSRDGNLMARYAILDTETRRVRFLGLNYDHVKTVDKLRRSGLVPVVDLQKATGTARYVEAMKVRWARFRHKSNPRFA
jgi:predicted phosphodiesterase